MMHIETLTLQDELHRTAGEAIDSERKLVVKAYGMIHSTEDFMRSFIKKTMHKFERPDLTSVVEIIMKEFTMNAVKANFKKIFFTENNLDLDDATDYEVGMAKFMDLMSESIFLEYGLKAREAQLTVETSFDFDENRCILEVRNNLPMAAHEEQRAREKMGRALQYDDIAAFMLEQLDETEGAGAGLALCLTAMRSADIDPRLLTIITDSTTTVARAEIPLKADYVPSKPRWPNALAG